MIKLIGGLKYIRGIAAEAEQYMTIYAHPACSAARIVGGCWLKMLRLELAAAAAAARCWEAGAVRGQ